MCEVTQYVKASFTPKEAIVCATHNNAEMLGLLDELGIVEEGKLVDLILVDGDPLADAEENGWDHIFHDGVPANC